MHSRRELVAAVSGDEISWQRGIFFKQRIDVAAALYVPDEMGERRRPEGVKLLNEALKSLARDVIGSGVVSWSPIDIPEPGPRFHRGRVRCCLRHGSRDALVRGRPSRRTDLAERPAIERIRLIQNNATCFSELGRIASHNALGERSNTAEPVSILEILRRLLATKKLGIAHRHPLQGNPVKPGMTRQFTHVFAFVEMS
jgi:hypothetical protein